MRNKQKGVAIILFSGMLPLMIMLFVVAIQLTQQTQANAKITEATEVASLALISETTGTNEPNVQLAVNIIDTYVKDNTERIEVSIDPINCKRNSDCYRESGELAPFTDFVVSATSKHNSWLAYTGIGLDPEFNVTAKSTSRKLIPEPIDLYLVVDFSASMRKLFGTKTRIDEVVRTVERLIADIKRYNNFNRHKSRIALIGYHELNVKLINGRRERIDYVIENNPKKTVDNMFKTKIILTEKYLGKWYARNVPTVFYDVPLTEEYSKIMNMLGSVYIGLGVTASWQGLIAAGQEINRQTKYNPRQVLIILSDGGDEPRKSYQLTDSGTNVRGPFLPQLVEHGLCDNLTNMVNSKTDRYGQPVKFISGVIGINYEIDRSINGMYDCVGEDNIFHATGNGDIYKQILQLIGEETGRLR